MNARIIIATCIAGLALAPASGSARIAACDGKGQLGIAGITDGGGNDGHGPDLAIDGDFRTVSRWSSAGAGKALLLDLGAPQVLTGLGLALLDGDARTTSFEVATSRDGTAFAPLIGRTESGGETAAIERFDAAPTEARYVRATFHGNSETARNDVIEVQAYGCGPGAIPSQGDGTDISAHGLNVTVPPSENFDLGRWRLSLPVDRNGDGRADWIGETKLAGGWTDDDMFYTDPVTGGMVFRPAGGGGATPAPGGPRVELREMLRAGDRSIPMRGSDGMAGANNWVFSAAPEAARQAAGAVDGTMHAKVRVNRVTRQGDPSKVGRVVIGQIHARSGRPIQLYYRKLPDNKFGSLYYVHERDGGNVTVPILGGTGDRIDNPADGIALDEAFEYQIRVTGETVGDVMHPMLHVSITRDDGTVTRAEPLDMIDSPYLDVSERMFFKAGARSGNATSPEPDRDFDQVTFLELHAIHP